MAESPEPEGTASPVIAFRGVSFSYVPGTPVLEEATFSVASREMACIIGPNGGGKTTLLNLLLGTLKPDTGEVNIFGQEPERARLRIGYMPQSLAFDTRFPITVQEIVLMGRLDRCRFGFFGRVDREAAGAALSEVGLDGFSSRRFSDLSGGQRQRVLIARALAGDPQLLLLDEPTANIDQAVEEKFFDTLVKLNERMAIVMVSHDLGVVSSLAENVICVNRTVQTHPTSSLTGRSIEEIYGMEIQAVHHRQDDRHEEHNPAGAPPR